MPLAAYELGRRAGEASVDPQSLPYGAPILVRHQALRSLHCPWRLGHKLDVEGQSRLVVACGGRISVEHHHNVIPLTPSPGPGDHLFAPLLPNRRGQYVVVHRTPVQRGKRGRPSPLELVRREAARPT